MAIGYGFVKTVTKHLRKRALSFGSFSLG